MIQRIDGPQPQSAQPGPEPPRGPERGPGDRRLEVVLIVALATVGTALAALVALRALDADSTRLTTLDTGTAPPEAPRPRLAHAALDPARLHEDVQWLASPERQGRDTPSPGLRDAQVWVAQRLAAAGAAPVPGLTQGSTLELPDDLAPYAHVYSSDGFGFGEWPAEAPDPERCGLDFGDETCELHVDFVPLTSSSTEDPLFRGDASGAPVFVGYGIDNPGEDYDDFDGVDLDGALAVVLDGEPDVGFGGPEITAESSIWNKLDALERHGARGALVVSSLELQFRTSRARWMPPDFDKERSGLPALVVSASVAERILGAAPATLRLAAGERPLTREQRAQILHPVQRVSMSAGTVRRPVELVNVVGVVPGTRDNTPALFVTAHLDHIGVGPRGRIGHGADDNGSGVAAALGILRAVSQHPLPNPVVFAFPSGEEDGLLGSTALSGDWVRERGKPALCVNLDMVGRGDPTRAVLLRGAEAKDQRRLDSWIGEAVRSAAHGFEDVRRVADRSFFRRSDHFAFYQQGVPSIFLFETWPLDEGIYHTWRDVPERVSGDKLARMARLGLLLLEAAADPGSP